MGKDQENDELTSEQKRLNFLKYLNQQGKFDSDKLPYPSGTKTETKLEPKPKTIIAAEEIIKDNRQKIEQARADQQEAERLIQKERERQEAQKKITQVATSQEPVGIKVEEKTKLFDQFFSLIAGDKFSQKLSFDIQKSGFQTKEMGNYKLVRLSIENGDLLMGIMIDKDKLGEKRKHILAHFSDKISTEEMFATIVPFTDIITHIHGFVELRRKVQNAKTAEILENNINYLNLDNYLTIKQMKDSAYYTLSNLTKILNLYFEGQGTLIKPKTLLRRLKDIFHLS